MRIIAYFNNNTLPVPVNNQSVINGYVHKCLGENNKYHDSFSNYNISHLWGGKLTIIDSNPVINFNNYGKLIISSKDEEFLNSIIRGINKNKFLEWGMAFSHFDFIDEKFYDGVNHFYTLSPILLKEITGEKTYRYITVNDEDFDKVLTERTINKLLKYDSNLDLTNFSITSSKTGREKVKEIMVKNVCNKSSQCNLDITCNKKVAEVLYNLGLGQSCGSGFGCIYKTESHELYN
jgi:CRISPR-associated endoribonuclease Cas6